VPEYQKTIGKKTCFSGMALQTGQTVNMVCLPAEPDSGIVFKRTDISGNPILVLSGAEVSAGGERRSTIGSGQRQLHTVEHFLAALWGLGVDNILVEIDAMELPAMDGSAMGFLKPLKNSGITEQGVSRREIKITEPEIIKEGNSSLRIFPHDVFRVSYLIDYDVACVGKTVFEVDLDRRSFEKEIAPARTFCLKKEAEALLKAGLGAGATLENTLVLDEDGPVGTRMRFPDEPVRHKILDLVGDLYMLARPIIGKVMAERSGHALNAEMVKRIYEKYVKNCSTEDTEENRGH